jgi:hypothetical protein
MQKARMWLRASIMGFAQAGHSVDHGDFVKLVDSIPVLPIDLIGDKPLTKRQLNGLMFRQRRYMFLIIWTLLYVTPVIRKVFTVSSYFEIRVDLSFEGVSVYKVLKVWNKDTKKLI